MGVSKSIASVFVLALVLVFVLGVNITGNSIFDFFMGGEANDLEDLSFGTDDSLGDQIPSTNLNSQKTSTNLPDTKGVLKCPFKAICPEDPKTKAWGSVEMFPLINGSKKKLSDEAAKKLAEKDAIERCEASAKEKRSSCLKAMVDICLKNDCSFYSAKPQPVKCKVVPNGCEKKIVTSRDWYDPSVIHHDEYMYCQAKGEDKQTSFTCDN